MTHDEILKQFDSFATGGGDNDAEKVAETRKALEAVFAENDSAKGIQAEKDKKIASLEKQRNALYFQVTGSAGDPNKEEDPPEEKRGIDWDAIEKEVLKDDKEV